MTSPEPLYRLIRSIRQPSSFRELIAACLRSIHMGDPFSDRLALPDLPESLKEGVTSTEETISGVRCVIYSPKERDNCMPFMLYMHGGGFVVGCSEDTDFITRMLCYSNKIVVVSLNYRLAPETIFPGQLIDCRQVFISLVDQASRFGIDANTCYLAGDSAGANLAIAMASQLKEHLPVIRGLILLAPWLDMQVENYESFNRLAPANIVLDSAFLSYARAAYIGFEEWKNPLASPVFGCLSVLPSTLVIIGTEDPLLDQSLKLQEKARELNSEQIEMEIYPGMPHSFYQFPKLFSETDKCYERIAAFIARVSAGADYTL